MVSDFKVLIFDFLRQFVHQLQFLSLSLHTHIPVVQKILGFYLLISANPHCVHVLGICYQLLPVVFFGLD